jgi:Dolichyl-phosphate-mannose-protein mannosyltransferase
MSSTIMRAPFIGQETVKLEVPSQTKVGHLVTGSLVVFVLALFMGFIFNRSLPINEGWFHYYAWLMHKGQMPYRDFWYISQPFDLCIAWLFAGDHLINLRIFGLVERIVLSGLLYFLLSRQFSPKASFLATLVSMMVLLTYLTEGFFTFLIDSLFFLVAGLICVYEAQTHPRHQKWFLVLAGVCGSLCFFSKQSTGLLATIALAILIVWFDPDIRRFIQRLVYYSIGWSIIAAPILVWILSNSAWTPYVNEVFKGAASSKGSLRTVFGTTVSRNFYPRMLALDIAVLLLLAVAVRKRYLIFKKPQETTFSKRDITLTVLIALVVMFVPIFLRLGETGVELLREYLAVLAKMLFMGIVLQFMWLGLRWLRWRRPLTQPVTALLIISAFFWAYGCQMSNKVEQHAIVLGLAFFVAFACDNISSRSGKSLIGLMTALCLLQVGESALYKYNDAYDWNGWRSVIPLHTAQSHWPQLAGFNVDQTTVHIIDTILDDIARDTRPGEPIFTFPHMPMFNFITGHPQPTFAPVHYWDVCPDWVADADAGRVKAARPAVIVNMEMPEWLWADGELTFRRGKKSGQRTIDAMIKQLAASGDYRLQDSFKTHWECRVNVWQRIR